MEPRCTAVVAATESGVIGVDGKLPWHYPEDLKRFKRLTVGGTVIMGRVTFESMGKKPLPGRRNIVITRARFSGVECRSSVEAALAGCAAAEKIFIIGGAQLYRTALRHCGRVDFTLIPENPPAANAVFFPDLPADQWRRGPAMVNEHDPRLRHCTFTRRR